MQFTADNTSGYTSEQLDRANALFDERATADMDHSERSSIAEQVLREIDDQLEVVQFGSDLNPETRKRRVARRGGIHSDLSLAAAEATARTLQGEGKPPWVVIRADGERVEDLSCEPDQVVDALLLLGATEDEANRLVA